jgi:hypothetical protein
LFREFNATDSPVPTYGKNNIAASAATRNNLLNHSSAIHAGMERI